ncbi:hypothetical protein BAY61_14620 [Prauserella marina]|uniref:Uncharacterized protein n=1 Tax=Prauserella marina TaxID=530584 RepID=A0A222VQA7_9PSEU|nr:hypothetical protein [Prauserella marina]ASR36032.1 hypothetical protein BAY61_14620 [Prauserella marina]PWV84016.1 hypothetical protein DES30_10133 [Prauserella marina]SDC32402.1 hypothetical protein SAMN05421630_1011304 [Prauserella marina]
MLDFRMRRIAEELAADPRAVLPEPVGGLIADDSEAAGALGDLRAHPGDDTIHRLTVLLERAGERDPAVITALRAWLTDRAARTHLPGELAVSCHLPGTGEPEAVLAEVERLVRLAGSEVVAREDTEEGSWFHTSPSAPSGPPGTTERPPLAEALESRPAGRIDPDDAVVTAALMRHLGPLLESVQGSDTAAVRLGALLVVKAGAAMAVHQLTDEQQRMLDSRPALLATPAEVLPRLGLAGTEPAYQQTAAELSIEMAKASALIAEVREELTRFADIVGSAGATAPDDDEQAPDHR